MPFPLDNALATWRRWLPGLNQPPEVLTKIPNGLTNQSWLIQTSRGKGVLRLNSPHQAIWGIDRIRENAVHRAATDHGIAPAIWYCDPVQGFLVTEFIEGDVLTTKSVNDDVPLEKIHDLVQRIQSIPLPLEKFNYWAHLDFYYQTLTRMGVTLPTESADKWQQFSPNIQQFQSSNWTPVLVHHDLFSGNIIASDNGLKVIDWEYAAGGHPDMELLVLATYHSQCDPLLLIISELLDDFWLLLHNRLVAIDLP